MTQGRINNLNSNYSVVIVGGGLVGSALALALKKVDCDILVVEAFESGQNQPSFDDRTVALSQSSIEILSDELGVRDLVKSIEPIRNIHVSDKGNYGFTRLNAKDYSLAQLGGVVENWKLGEVLLKQLERKKITYIAPAKVTKVEQSTEQATATIEYQGEERKIKADLIILADGVGSVLKGQLNFDTEITDYHSSAIVCNLSTQQGHNNCAFERFTEEGPLALLPLSGNRMSLVWTKKQSKLGRLVTLNDIDFAKKLEETFGARLGKITKVGQRKSFPLLQSVTVNTIKGRCLLIGNSAQSLHPIAGQGLNLAIRDIHALQKEVMKQKVIDGDFNIGDYGFLNQYQKNRNSDRKETIASTEALARLFSNKWLPLSFSRNLLMKLTDVTPAIKETLAKKAMGYR